MVKNIHFHIHINKMKRLEIKKKRLIMTIEHLRP